VNDAATLLYHASTQLLIEQSLHRDIPSAITSVQIVAMVEY
jgi:hypothetical protein